MDSTLLEVIYQQNPWLESNDNTLITGKNYVPRLQYDFLCQKDWDSLWTVIVGPRQAGKTTLGKFLCAQLIKEKRFDHLLYLNCDYREIRKWLNSSNFITEAEQSLKIKNYILFIDEVQRLESPGLLLKIIADLKLPIKMIASGSSQLEIKSKVQEHLTGRQLECLVLPLSVREIGSREYQSVLQFGSYPQIYLAKQKQIFLQELFNNYIQKDIVEFLQVRKPDILVQLLGLLAHSSGQLINYQQLANDCRIKIDNLRNFIDILEKTYVIKMIKPYVGNKRTELTSNPICYFIDNGFRNQSLNNFSPIETRTDNGLLVENYFFQELYKYLTQERKNGQIHYWRTKAGAEVDFVLKMSFETVVPIEVKFRNSVGLNLTRGYKSFLEAYEPKLGFVITKDQMGTITHLKSEIHFVPITNLQNLFEIITSKG